MKTTQNNTTKYKIGTLFYEETQKIKGYIKTVKRTDYGMFDDKVFHIYNFKSQRFEKRKNLSGSKIIFLREIKRASDKEEKMKLQEVRKARKYFSKNNRLKLSNSEKAHKEYIKLIGIMQRKGK